MKNIIALRIPTFITRDKGEAARMFSNFINDNTRKNIKPAIRKSKSNFVIIVSEFPKSSLPMKRRNAERKKN